MAYIPTVWVNNTPPAMAASNLNKLVNELSSQANAQGVAHSLPIWHDNAPPAITDAPPWNEMERVCAAVATSLGLGYTQTNWQAGWTPARNAANLNKLEQQARANRDAMEVAPPTGYPASFFTGPLGNGNIVPSDPATAFTILWSGTNGWSPQQTRDHIVQRSIDCGRSWPGIECQLDQLTVGGSYGEDWIATQGAFTVSAWTPSQPGGASLTAINAGTNDGEIRSVADRFAAHGGKVMVAPFREFNGNWYPWSATVATAPQFISAFRRIVDIFAQRGASNCGFVFNPTEGQPRDIRDACYPGDDYVDWSSTTGYNGFSSSWSTPFHDGWARFREIFDYTNMGSGLVSSYSAYAHRKPYIPTECGSKYDFSDVNRKGNWFREVDSEGKANMPNLLGICWFDNDVSGGPYGEPGNDWRVDHAADSTGAGVGVYSAESYQGFKDLVALPRWKGVPA